MLYYNDNTKEIEDSPVVIITSEGVTLYTQHITDFTQYGYYLVQYINEKPDPRYYDYTENNVINGDNYEITYIPSEKPLEDVKYQMKQDVKANAEEKILAICPYWKQNNTQSEYGILLERKIDGIITEQESDYFIQLKLLWDQIINRRKDSDAVEDSIDALTTIEDCVSFENEAYDYVLTAEDMVDYPENIEGDVVTKYRNNTLEW